MGIDSKKGTRETLKMGLLKGPMRRRMTESWLPTTYMDQKSI